MKVRLIEEYDSLRDSASWHIEKHTYLGWVRLGSFYREDTRDEAWERAKRGQISRSTYVIDEAEV